MGMSDTPRDVDDEVSLSSEEEKFGGSNSRNKQMEDATTRNGPKQQQQERGAAAGKVHSVELFDFMCHRHLLITLSPNINFIIGNNGSGKSAILTALTVCLGGRASATQRATSVDSLIREGSHSAKVRIRLNNEGEKAFQPDSFGSYIIIERSFRRDGQNSYSIYSSNGKLVGNRKDIINSVCDHFGIQVDNPLAVLTQETAKKFLSNARPKELYEFFMKATQLEQLSIDYNFATEKLSESQTRLDQSKTLLAPLRSTIEMLETQLGDLEKLKTLAQAVEKLRSELLWAVVTDQEGKVKGSRFDYDKERESLEDINTQVDHHRSKIAQILEQLKDMEGDIETEITRANPLKIQKEELLKKIRSTELGLASLIQDAKDMNTEFYHLKTLISELQEKMDAENNAGSSRNREKLRNRLSEVNLGMIDANAGLIDLRKEETATNTDIENLELEISSCRDKVQEEQSCGRSLRGLLETKIAALNDSTKLYGDKMPLILEEIRKSVKKFSLPPVGPAGLYMKIKDPKWGLAVQVIVHKNVTSFLVNTHRDCSELQAILRKHSAHFPIVVLKFDGRLDIGAGKPDRIYTTALDVIDISSQIVEKMLIINCEIEKQILIENRQEATLVAQNRPRNVRSIYTPEHRFNFGQNTVSCSYLSENQRLPKIGENVNEAIKGLEMKLVEFSRREEIVKNDLNQREIAAEALRRKLDDISHRQKGLNRLIESLKEEARNINDELRGEETFSQSVFEQEKVETEGKLAAVQAQFNSNQKQQDSARALIQDSKTRLADIEQEIRAFDEGAEEYTRKLSDSVKIKTRFQHELDKCLRSVKEKELIVSDLKRQVDEEDAGLNEMIRQASQLSPRVPVIKSAADLDVELMTCMATLEANKKVKYDPVKLKDELQAKRAQLKESEKSISVNENLIKSLQNSLEQRQRAWEDFRRSVSKLSSLEFIMMMGTRGFQGSLEYRHHDAELHIKVIPQGQINFSKKQVNPRPDNKRRKSDGVGKEDAHGGENRDIKQLSGGEKSYSTACFLFSLWQAMGSPLRCLDEFDVYMDPVNRNYVLTLLIQHARSSKVQFILITPNSIPDSYRTAQDVRIHGLRDPERNQTTLS